MVLRVFGTQKIRNKMSNRLFLFAILLLSIAFTVIHAEGGCGLVKSEDPCPDTEYLAYVTCIQRRSKRSVRNCNSEATQPTCNECDCNYCGSHECSDSCNACCTPSCETAYCCHKTCHAQCKHAACRKECKRTCAERIKKAEEVVADIGQISNITTIINLKNHINNTNIIDVPVFINNTNINNVTLDEELKVDLGNSKVDGEQPTSSEVRQNEIVDDVPKEPGREQPDNNVARKEQTEEDCCQIISPRQCVPKTEYPFVQCFHYRQKTCGAICESPIMHAQPHLICDEVQSGPPNCHNQVIYVPQPQPRCTYQEQWPYVSCQIHQENCDACYGHFTGYQSNTGCPISCTSGYNVGPYYQGSYPQPYPTYGGSYGGSYGYNQQYPQYPNMGMQAMPYENYYSVARNPQQVNPEISDPNTLYTKFLNPGYTGESAELQKTPSVDDPANMFLNFLNNETIAEEVPLKELEHKVDPIEPLVKIKLLQTPSLLVQQAEDTTKKEE